MLQRTTNDIFNTHLILIDTNLWQCNLRSAIMMYLYSKVFGHRMTISHLNPALYTLPAHFNRRATRFSPDYNYESNIDLYIFQNLHPFPYNQVSLNCLRHH